jgi:hypothetical protein
MEKRGKRFQLAREKKKKRRNGETEMKRSLEVEKKEKLPGKKRFVTVPG